MRIGSSHRLRAARAAPLDKRDSRLAVANCKDSQIASHYALAKARGLRIPPVEQPSFSDFKSWLDENDYALYLDFRSVAGPDEDAEQWFDQEIKQTWRS
jgi:hypothetical protein